MEVVRSFDNASQQDEVDDVECDEEGGVGGGGGAEDMDEGEGAAA